MPFLLHGYSDKEYYLMNSGFIFVPGNSFSPFGIIGIEKSPIFHFKTSAGIYSPLKEALKLMVLYALLIEPSQQHLGSITMLIDSPISRCSS